MVILYGNQSGDLETCSLYTWRRLCSFPLALSYHFFKRLKFNLGDPDLRGMFLVVSVIILLGGLFYHKVEGWSFLDSIYFCIVTLATVGYGDFTPHTPFGKLFTVIHIFMRVGMLAVFVSTVADYTLHEQHDRSQKKSKNGISQAAQDQVGG